MKALEGIKTLIPGSLSRSHTHVMTEAAKKRRSGVCVRSLVWHKEKVRSELESEREHKVKNTLEWFSCGQCPANQGRTLSKVVTSC